MTDWSFLHACDMQPGSPRSFRFNPRFAENWNTAYQQLKGMDADLLLVGGDLTRDGSLHDFEFEAIKDELDELPYPYHAIPGNMDSGNKHANRDGATGREDTTLNVEEEPLERFEQFFGSFPWSFVHKNVRFSGFYAAIADSGTERERAMWEWLENSLPSHATTKHHVMVMHYPLFMDRPDEPTWDITRKEEYLNWYFTIDEPHRSRIINALKKAHVDIVLTGHIHCRRPPQFFDGIRHFKCAGIAMPQFTDKWDDGDPRLGFYRFDVTDSEIQDTFIPLVHESTATGAYGPGGHPRPEERVYPGDPNFGV